MSILRAFAPLLSLAACLTAPAAPGLNLELGPGTHVLFIGNSLTYTNNLPDALASLARFSGDTIVVRSVAFPDYALEDHWNEGTARQALRSARWDVVLMQQGPSSLPENQAFLRTWTERFAPDIRASGATPALFMVWPSSARSQDWDGVHAAYKNAAAAVGGLFVPAGDAWRRGLARSPSVPVYGPDGFHPSLVGTMLAALVIHERITGRDARTLSLPVNHAGIPDLTWRVLQSLAHEAVTAATP